MMEILHRGEPPSEKQYTESCKYCHTKVRFKRHEAKYHSGYQREPDCLSVVCPVCGKRIYAEV